MFVNAFVPLVASLGYWQLLRRAGFVLMFIFILKSLWMAMLRFMVRIQCMLCHVAFFFSHICCYFTFSFSFSVLIEVFIRFGFFSASNVGFICISHESNNKREFRLCHVDEDDDDDDLSVKRIT